MLCHWDNSARGLNSRQPATAAAGIIIIIIIIVIIMKKHTTYNKQGTSYLLHQHIYNKSMAKTKEILQDVSLCRPIYILCRKCWWN